MNAHFEQPGRLVVGSYLLGQYRWPSATRLLSARLTGRSPTTLTTLGAEVGGVLASPRIYVFPSALGESRVSVSLDLIVPATQEVRWKVLSAPAAEADQACAVALDLDALPVTVSDALVPTSRLWVVWVSGPERIHLWEYHPGSRTFTETTAGIAAGRAAIATTPDLTVSIQETLAMQITADGQFKVNELVDSAQVGLLSGPSLEFWRADHRFDRRLARLSKAGVFMVTNATEAAPVASVENFECLGGGVLKASLGESGLTADWIQEGI